MAENRLKIKIGEHEFEAEGPVEIVQAQLAAFSELVSKIPASPPPKPAEAAQPNAGEQQQQNGRNGGGDQLNLDKIMRADGRLVSLTVSTEDVADSALLLLYGQRHYRNNDSVTGGEVLDGLRETGQNVSRIDYTLHRLAADGFVITTGSGRGRRYRLNNRGVQRAQELARELISNVP